MAIKLLRAGAPNQFDVAVFFRPHNSNLESESDYY